MLAAASAWDALAAELQSTAASYRAAITELTGGGAWLGASSAEMTAATLPRVDWMAASAAQAEQTATQARAAAAAYERAFAMTVPPPAIAATEVEYAEMWAQDAAAMYGYAGATATASALTPSTEPRRPRTRAAQHSKQRLRNRSRRTVRGCSPRSLRRAATIACG